MNAFKEIRIGAYVLRFWPSDNGWMCGITPEMMDAIEQAEKQVVFKIYKPTLPRGAIPNVRDAELPWVYDQDPSSGNVASMWVTPVKATPQPQREWVGLTDEQIDQGLCRTPYAMKTAEAWREGVRWAYHQIKEKNT